MSQQPNPTSEEIGELAELLSQIKTLGFDDRYDVYAELYREDWPTDAGFLLLPNLWDCLSTVVDLVRLEVAHTVGSIQRSIAVDGETGCYDEIVSPYVEGEKIRHVIGLLQEGREFCGPNLPLDQCDELISLLSKHIAPERR
jgi:hypothetical protein